MVTASNYQALSPANMPDCQPSQDPCFSTGVHTNLLIPMKSGPKLSKRHRANIGHFNVLASKRLTFADLPVILHYTKNRHIQIELDFMHKLVIPGVHEVAALAAKMYRIDFKIILPGVHEIAALVAKIAFAMSLGTILPSVRIVRPENTATIVPRAQRLASLRIVRDYLR